MLGPHWLPWFQPQHQHLIPAGNLRQALADRGASPSSPSEHGAAHQSNGDFLGAVALTANRLAPDPLAPWATVPATRPAGAARVPSRPWRFPATPPPSPSTPCAAVVARTTDGGNAYRLLARKELG